MKKFISRCVCALLLMNLLVGCQGDNPIKFKQNLIKLELGEELKEAKEYIDTKDEDVLNGIKYDTSSISVRSGTDYPATGVYKVPFTYKNSKNILEVVVEDTIKPAFSKDFKKDIDLYEGQSYDFTRHYHADDKNLVTINADTSKLNVNKTGKYIVTITATDDAGNEVSQDVNVTVKKKSLKLNKHQVTLHPGEKIKLTAKVDGPSKYVAYESKNKNVASISSNGVIKANKEGKTTVIAESNGIKETCEVNVVKKEPQSTPSQSQTPSNPQKPSQSTGSQSNSTNGGSSSGTNVSPKPQEPYVASLKAAKKYSKIMVVSASNYSTSRGTFEYFTKSNGAWKKQFSTPAQLGSRGLGKVKEGDRKTPTGLYTFTKVMGIASNPGTKMPYHKIDSNDYWCGGKNHYNQFVDEDTMSHNCNKTNDEKLIKYKTPYQYLAVLNYNASNIYGKGSAIFLHCNGNSGVTAGCVGINKTYMKKVIKEIDSNTCIIIDVNSKISNY